MTTVALVWNLVRGFHARCVEGRVERIVRHQLVREESCRRIGAAGASEIRMAAFRQVMGGFGGGDGGLWMGIGLWAARVKSFSDESHEYVFAEV